MIQVRQIPHHVLWAMFSRELVRPTLELAHVGVIDGEWSLEKFGVVMDAIQNGNEW